MYERHPSETPTESVIAAVADVTGRSPLEMPPITEVIDPDALNTLLKTDDTNTAAMSVTFEYYGVNITAMPETVIVEQ